jgi:replicative DNA helicase
LADLCKELNIPGIILAQLNREVEKDGGRMPRLSDLKQSGSIEEDADTILLLHRVNQEEDANPYESLPHDVDLIVAKRRNGPRGFVHTIFQPAFTQFIPRSKVSDDDVPPEQQGYFPDQ